MASEVVERLARIETQIESLHALQLERNSDVDELRDGLRKVELFQAKLVGIMLILGSVPAALISWLLRG